MPDAEVAAAVSDSSVDPDVDVAEAGEMPDAEVAEVSDSSEEPNVDVAGVSEPPMAPVPEPGDDPVEAKTAAEEQAEWFEIMAELLKSGYHVFVFEQFKENHQYSTKEVKRHNLEKSNWSPTRFQHIAKFHIVVLTPAQICIADHLENVSLPRPPIV